MTPGPHERPTDPERFRCDDPSDEGSQLQRQDDPVEPPEGCGQMRGVAFGQPVPGETGDHPAADQADQHDHRRNRQPQPMTVGLEHLQHLEMHKKISGEQTPDGDGNRQVPPIPPGDDFANNDGEKDGQKRQIDQGCRNGSDLRC